MDPRTSPPLSDREKEDVIDLVTSLPASVTCATDAKHAVEQELALEPEAAGPLVDNLMEQRAIEARTATANDETRVGGGKEPDTTGTPPYKLVRTAERRSGD